MGPWPIRDDARKIHDAMIDWPELSEAHKDKDRDTVRNIPCA